MVCTARKAQAFHIRCIQLGWCLTRQGRAAGSREQISSESSCTRGLSRYVSHRVDLDREACCLGERGYVVLHNRGLGLGGLILRGRAKAIRSSSTINQIRPFVWEVTSSMKYCDHCN